MTLEWSPFAVADREAIFDYIASDSPSAAVAVDERIETHINSLAAFPEMGRPGRIPGTRELVISRTPYLAAYHYAPPTLRILRILHGAQQWPDELIEGQSSPK
jgi:addiction module RelE/StbE family toxin